MPAQITQKTIARLAGVDPSTVSLALARSEKILPDTRERILGLARSLGYQRDPMLGALAAYRKASRKPTFHGVLGWLVDSAAGFDWRGVARFARYHEGAAAAAAELGYRLEAFDLEAHRGNPARLTSILRSRGIRGVLVCPQPHAHARLELDFAQLAAIVLGHTVEQPRLHLVAPADFENVRWAVRELRARGYRRIGYAVPAERDERADRAFSTAYGAEAAGWAAEERVETLDDDPEPARFAAWLARARPDALLVPSGPYCELLARLGVSVPADLGLAQVSVMDGDAKTSGIDEDSWGIGHLALSRLADLVEERCVGPPQRPQRLLVAGKWVEGATVLPLGA